ncbi:MAG: hypothetical protein AABX14_02305 [Candidatus Aenigmatarchaeota archaeon]
MGFFKNAIICLSILTALPSGEAPRYYAIGKVDNIHAMVSYLYNVPEKVRQKVNRFGGEIVFLEKISSAKLPRDDTLLLLAAGAIYNPDMKKSFVIKNDENCGIKYRMAVPQLHEYGHMVDHAFGYPSEKNPFVDIKNSSSEMFAEDFAKFYCGEETRNGLKETNIASFRYFEKFDRKYR